MWQAGWYIDQRVIHCRVIDSISIEELRAMNDHLSKMVDQGTAPVHLMLDGTDMKSFPRNLNTLREASHIIRHPGIGWLIAVGVQNPLLTFIGSIVTQIDHKSQYRMIASVDEAWTHLQTTDATLENAKPSA
jgi:hypothetical protein